MQAASAGNQEQTYNYRVVRQFSIMTVVWGVVGMLVGVIIAAQLAWPELLPSVPWLSYGRLRPLHTNAVIFAFGGCALFATSYYVVQRTCHVRLVSDRLAGFTFWGWQAVIVLAAVTLPLGMTQGEEYAELEWPIDLLIAVVWVSYAIVFFGTIMKRRIPHIYVANWFFGAFILTVAILHIVNSAFSPASFTKSYSAYAGVQDAMIQWWYGHNAVGFFLTAGFLGMMYYFIPKQAERPVYSYRLSVVHFWALIFTYMWAGPHHLHYTALPDWAQSLGMVFSLILLAPSWVGMISIGSMYYLIPRLFGRTGMYSVRAITLHFWVATIGIVLYITSMWIAGVMQGLMWRAVNADGTLTYTFVESVKASWPYYVVRLAGGVLYLGGMLIMCWNVWKTVVGSQPVDAPVPAPAMAHA